MRSLELHAPRAALTPGSTMIVFNHIPRTGGTFLLERLRQTDFGRGPSVEFAAAGRFVPRLICDQECRPVMLVYHCGGRRFESAFHRRAGDFVFTFLRNRVDMVYSNFAYMKLRIRRGDDLPGWTEAQRRYFERTMEEHVDGLLAAPAPDSEYPANLSTYDFVGITEEMSLSLQALNRVLGTSIADDRPANSVPSAKTYRRRELEQKFGEEMEVFRGARALLRKRPI